MIETLLIALLVIAVIIFLISYSSMDTKVLLVFFGIIGILGIVLLLVSETDTEDVVEETVAPLSHIAVEENPYTPQQVGSVYLGSVPYDGSGQKIGIITCYNHPNLQRDFDVYCKKYDLPYKQLVIHNRARLSDKGWSIETCLDTQWCHVFAPMAEIHVFQAATASYPSLKRALLDAVEEGVNIVSMSLGSIESAYARSQVQQIFDENPQICFMAASGDWQEVSYPSSSNKVLSVGGTRLYVESDGNNNSTRPVEANYAMNPTRFKKVGETGWFLPNGLGTGHGLSKLFDKPPYQTGHNASTKRATPDISLIAATPTQNGLSIYYNKNPGASVLPRIYNDSRSWIGVEGTSASCPILAGMLATINSARISQSKPPMNREAFLEYVYGSVPTNLPVETSHDGAGYVGRNLIQLCVSA
jgi:subtilase family serine protease